MHLETMEALRSFYESQLLEWPMARDNHEALSCVWSRELTSPKLPMPLHVQCNPARIVSTGASTDKASIASRPCFLCSTNRPKEQRSHKLNEEFEWLVNPYPFFQHSKQHIHASRIETCHRTLRRAIGGSADQCLYFNQKWAYAFDTDTYRYTRH